MNEEMLWHGTSGSAAEIIATEGFDHRVGVKNGRAYGDGIYFTRDAILALRYRYNLIGKKGIIVSIFLVVLMRLGFPFSVFRFCPQNLQ